MVLSSLSIYFFLSHLSHSRSYDQTNDFICVDSFCLLSFHFFWISQHKFIYCSRKKEKHDRESIRSSSVHIIKYTKQKKSILHFISNKCWFIGRLFNVHINVWMNIMIMIIVFFLLLSFLSFLSFHLFRVNWFSGSSQYINTHKYDKRTTQYKRIKSGSRVYFLLLFRFDWMRVIFSMIFMNWSRSAGCEALALHRFNMIFYTQINAQLFAAPFFSFLFVVTDYVVEMLYHSI